jgi:membrane-bound metal-dependent hydrolase YbcI (DUF457 family)
MDNLTHTLFAATLARTPLGRGRGATTALLLASNAPDIDIVATIGGAATYLQWHRGPTHGPLGIIALGLATAGLVWTGFHRVDRGRNSEHAPYRRLAAVSIAGVLLHVLMDFPTSYGSRVLSPFDWYWYAVDLMPIIDVYLLGILALGLILAGRERQELPLFRRLPSRRQRWAIAALALMVLNYGLRAVTHQWALTVAPRALGSGLPDRCDGTAAEALFVERWPRPVPAGAQPPAGSCLIQIAAVPTFRSPFAWRVIAQLSDAYEIREIDLLDLDRQDIGTQTAAGTFHERHPNRWTPAVESAAGAPMARVFLGFSRFPAVAARVEGDGTTVHWRDVRFGPVGVSADAESGRDGPFQLVVRLTPDGRVIEENFGP